MLEIIKAIIYGIVEGITEWLPISSTGHLILVERLIPFQQTSEGFFDMFDVVIQLGAILAVVVLFWNKIWPFYISLPMISLPPSRKLPMTISNTLLSVILTVLPMPIITINSVGMPTTRRMLR